MNILCYVYRANYVAPDSKSANAQCEDEDDEQYLELEPSQMSKRQITPCDWAAYYLQIRKASLDDHRLQRLERLLEVCVLFTTDFNH